MLGYKHSYLIHSWLGNLWESGIAIFAWRYTVEMFRCFKLLDFIFWFIFQPSFHTDVNKEKLSIKIHIQISCVPHVYFKSPLAMIKIISKEFLVSKFRTLFPKTIFQRTFMAVTELTQQKSLLPYGYKIKLF